MLVVDARRKFELSLWFCRSSSSPSIRLGIKIEKGTQRTLPILIVQEGCCQKLGSEVFLASWHTKTMRAGAREGRGLESGTSPSLVNVLFNSPHFPSSKTGPVLLLGFGTRSPFPSGQPQSHYSAAQEANQLVSRHCHLRPLPCGLDPPVWPL